ncbi:MAG: hypothetical protein ACI4BB_11180 [Coprococcus sp.]
MLRRMTAAGVLGVLIALYVTIRFEEPAVLLAGAGWDGHGSDGFSLYMTVNWLILFLPVWLCGLWWYEHELLRATIALYRYRYLMMWHIRTYTGVLLSVLVPYLCMGITLMIFIQPKWDGLLMQSIMMITWHGLGLTAVTVVLRLLTGSMAISMAATAILEAIAKMLAVRQLLPPAYNYFTWGMIVYNRSLYGSSGFDIRASVIFQLLFMTGLVLFGAGRMKVLLLGRVTDAKNH